MKFIFYILLVLLTIYSVILCVLYVIQERFIFFPTYLPDDYVFSYFEHTEEIYFDVDKNTRIHALHFHVQAPKGVVLYFHGNTRSLDDWGYAAQEFTKHNWEVFMPDYRSYGKSRGQLSESGLYADADLCYEHLRKTFPEKEIIIYGRSLGTGIATQLASKKQPLQLILETPYYNMKAMVTKVVPVVPTFLLQFQFPNAKHIQKADCPVEIIHGTADALIPFAQAQQLYKVGRPRTTLTTIEGGEHNNLSDFEAWQKRVKKLLE